MVAVAAVPLERSAEDDPGLTLGLDAAVHRLVDDAAGRLDANIAPVLLASDRGQAAQIGLDQRSYLLEIEGADEGEGEVGGIGEAIPVESVRHVKARLRRVALRGRRPGPRVVLAHGYRDRVEEGRRRIGAAVG